jgi:CRP/FNR family transcriptional regulator, cyclic AMP receptor protein
MPEEIQQPIKGEFFQNRMLFLGLRDVEMDKLALLAKSFQYHPGEIIEREGSHEETIYIIAEGVVEIFVGEEGENECLLSTLQAWDENGPLLPQYEGDFFGEMSLVDNEPRSATARAKTEVTTYELQHSQLRLLASEKPDIFMILILNIARILSRRLRQATRNAQNGD